MTKIDLDVEYVKVKPQIKSITLTLELSEHEAKMLRGFCGSVAGEYKDSARGIMSEIYAALYDFDDPDYRHRTVFAQKI